MPADDTILCPDCGWTGAGTDLEVSGSDAACPVCGTVIEYAG